MPLVIGREVVPDRVACDAPPSAVIYIDMYHRGYVEARAVPGFTIVAPGAE